MNRKLAYLVLPKIVENCKALLKKSWIPKIAPITVNMLLSDSWASRKKIGSLSFRGLQQAAKKLL